MRRILMSLAVSTVFVATGAATQTPGRADLAKVVASRHDTTVKALQD